MALQQLEFLIECFDDVAVGQPIRIVGLDKEGYIMGRTINKGESPQYHAAVWMGQKNQPLRRVVMRRNKFERTDMNIPIKHLTVGTQSSYSFETYRAGRRVDFMVIIPGVAAVQWVLNMQLRRLATPHMIWQYGAKDPNLNKILTTHTVEHRIPIF
tara:strand:- start:237 stop:704 length:468 start_codon:yes stop_codon:yes gene_type:complete